MAKIEVTKHRMTRMSGKGDQVCAEWDTAVDSPERLAEIEAEFKKLQGEGYFAADLGTNTLIDEFNAETDILMLPRMAGGLV